MVTLAPLRLEGGRGSAATLTRSVLQVEDPDNPWDVLLMVLEPPRHGQLTRTLQHGGGGDPARRTSATVGLNQVSSFYHYVPTSKTQVPVGDFSMA